MDIARKESEGVSDKMAELDGDDDMLQVPQKSPPQKSPTKEPYSRDLLESPIDPCKRALLESPAKALL